jgi:hypothetical protein
MRASLTSGCDGDGWTILFSAGDDDPRGGERMGSSGGVVVVGGGAAPAAATAAAASEKAPLRMDSIPAASMAWSSSDNWSNHNWLAAVGSSRNTLVTNWSSHGSSIIIIIVVSSSSSSFDSVLGGYFFFGSSAMAVVMLDPPILRWPTRIQIGSSTLVVVATEQCPPTNKEWHVWQDV